jgi:hypothetical protein
MGRDSDASADRVFYELEHSRRVVVYEFLKGVQQDVLSFAKWLVKAAHFINKVLPGFKMSALRVESRQFLTDR